MFGRAGVGSLDSGGIILPNSSPELDAFLLDAVNQVAKRAVWFGEWGLLDVVMALEKKRWSWRVVLAHLQRMVHRRCTSQLHSRRLRQAVACSERAYPGAKVRPSAWVWSS